MFLFFVMIIKYFNDLISELDKQLIFNYNNITNLFNSNYVLNDDINLIKHKLNLKYKLNIVDKLNKELLYFIAYKDNNYNVILNLIERNKQINTQYYKIINYLKLPLTINTDDDNFNFLRQINEDIYNSYSEYIFKNSNLKFNNLFFNVNCNNILNTNLSNVCADIRKITYHQKHNNKSQYKVLKVPLKKIVKSIDITTKIEEIVCNINKLSIQSYLFIKAYVLFKYSNGIHIDVLDINFISMCVKVNTITSARGANTNNENKILLSELSSFYNDVFSLNREVKKFNVINLSNIVSRLKQQIKTAYSNNILFNFIKHLKYYVTTTFKIKSQKEYELLTTQEERNTSNSSLNKNIKNLMDDLLFNSDTCTGEYKKWLLINKVLLIPPINEIKKNVPYDLTTHTSKYFKYLIYINIELEKYKRKTFSIFPLNISIVPNNIELDTSSLINIFFKTTTTEVQKNIICFKMNIWNEFFKLDNKCFKYSKEYVFNGLITTDGISANLTFVNKSMLNVTLNNSLNAGDNFTYITEVKDLKELNDKYNFVYIDSGKNPDILYCGDKDNNFFKYTTKQRLTELGTIKNRKKLSKFKKAYNIFEIEKELACFNSKTCNYDSYMKYLTKKLEINNKLFKYYEMPFIRKMKYRGYINKLRSETKLVNSLKRKYEKTKKVILIYGDWSRKSQMKGCAPVPGIGLKRRLAQDFKIYNIDEFRTSCIDYYTKEPNKNPYVKNKQTKKEIKNNKPIKYKKLHSVLMSKIHTTLKSTGSNKKTKQLTRYQNRNRNAVLNMKCITEDWINHKKRLNPYSRTK